MYYTFIFLPPLSTEPHPYKEEDAASEGTDGLLWQADGVEDKCQHYTDANHGKYFQLNLNIFSHENKC